MLVLCFASFRLFEMCFACLGGLWLFFVGLEGMIDGCLSSGESQKESVFKDGIKSLFHCSSLSCMGFLFELLLPQRCQ